MLSGEYRRSPRIIELDARKAQARSQNKGNVIYEVMDGEELDKGQDILKRKRGRKKVKVRTVQDVVVNSVEYKFKKTATGNDEDHLVNDAIVPSGAVIPEKGKLELLLGILQRRDTQKIFAEPVNPDEVEYYYDVIQEPMDFGTIAKKLNEGSYRTLEEFEHDVFLVSNNAMLFNASNTVYYRQARALKELATRLFHALKTDPENFETEASIRRMGLGRRTKADLNCNSNNKNNTGIAARGYRAQRQFDDFEEEKRRTYRPWSSFLSENGSLVSSVYNSPKQLNLDEKVGLGYVESLKWFAKDLGPTAQKVAMKKVESYISEAMKVWNMTTNRQPWAPEMRIPNAVFASNIKVAPSFKVPSSTLGCQNISGDKMDIHNGFLNGGQASMNDTMNINNALKGGISQPGSREECLGDFGGKMTQSASRGFAPSLHLLGNSNGYQTFSGGTMDSPSSFWNGRNISAGNNMGMNDILNKGKGKLGDILDSNGYQTFAGGTMDSPSSFWKGGNMSAVNNVGMNDALNKGKGKLGDILDSNGYQTLAGGTMDSPFSFWDGGNMSAVNNVGMNDALNKGKGKIGDIMDSNGYRSPSSFWNGGNMSAVNNLGMNDALNKGKGKLGDRMDFQEKVVQPMRGGLDSGAAFKDYAGTQSNGIHLDSSFSNYDSVKGKLDFTALWNTKGKQKELGRTSMMVDAINVVNNVQTAAQASLWSRMQEPTPTRNCGASSSSWPPPSQVMTGLNSSQAIDFMSGIGSDYPGKGVCQKEAIADGEGSGYRTSMEQGGIVSDFFKTLEMGPQSSTEYCFQEQIISPEMTSLEQQKRELDSLCEVPPIEDWLAISPQKHVIRASSNAFEYERFQPQSRGESSSRAAADRRQQKQPMLDTELPQWTWL
ncbi:hypothetical protein REPUB_Repub03eG0283100 [Reevesia pubescens]